MNNQTSFFEHLVRQQQTALKSFIRSLGVLSNEVDDLTHETFIIAHQQWHKFDPELNVRNWLFGIAKNLVRNELRKNSRQRRIINDKLSLYLIEQQPASATMYDDHDVQLLKSCMHHLSDKNKKLVELKYVHENTSSVLAEQMEMSSTAVRIALMRIRRSLKNCLSKEVSDE